MKRVRVSIWMCDDENGAFVTGISRHGDFSELEFDEKRYNEMVKDVPIIEGCSWSYSFNWCET